MNIPTMEPPGPDADVREGTTEGMQVFTDPPIAAAPPAGNTSPAEYPGTFVELDESELAAAFPQGLPEQGGIYGLLCHEVLRGEGENAGKLGVGFRYVLVARINVRPSGLIVPSR